jgi:inner membrane protein
MLLPAHVSGAYLATLAMLRLSSWGRAGRFAASRGPILYGVIAGVLPDLDVVPFVLHAGLSGFGDGMGMHRATFMHTTLCAMLVGLAPLVLPVRQRSAWMVAGFTGVMTHLVLDSLTIGFGVMWLYPFSRGLYGLNLATRWYRHVWGDDWLLNYIAHPLFLIEVAIVAAAVLVAWRRRRPG